MNITQPVAIPKGVNAGLNSARQATMRAVLGEPRKSYNQDCQGITNPVLAKLVEYSRNVGPFKASGLKPALDSITKVFADIKIEQPEIYAKLGTAGMLCVRNIRGSATGISNHSWGTAIDLTLAGALDRYGDGKVQYGLTLIAPIFNRHGWYWGAVFGKEDGMHFEASEQLIRKWAAQELFAGNAVPAQVISLGDRGQEVRNLQKALGLTIDGIFGKGTQKAVIAFQKSKGLTADGAAGAKTWAALK
jgi:D-alanyl-D-alanine carboxypeptidase/Putative peptidoglycan binding domain